MTSVWRGKRPLPMGGYETEVIIGGKVKGKRRRKKPGVGIKAVNPSDFTKALNKRIKREKRRKKKRK